MRSIAFRFVGVERLPTKLSEFDVEAFFALTSDDIATIRSRFRRDRQVGAAIQLVFLRASGRNLDRVAVIPKNLLRYVGEQLGISAPTIASLQSIYRRQPTLYEHQRWARDYAGVGEFDDIAQRRLIAFLQIASEQATSLDELTQTAKQALFAEKTLIPAQSRLRDLAYAGFSRIEKLAVEAIQRWLPRRSWKTLVEGLYAHQSTDNSSTVVDWLRSSAGRHGPTTLNDALQKIALLRDWGVHEWEFQDTLSIARQRGFAHAFESRPPSITKRQSETTLIVEAVCFLRVSLLRLTDQSLHMAGRRAANLVQRARVRADTTLKQSSATLRSCIVEIQAVIADTSQSADDKLAAIRASILERCPHVPGTAAARVREALSTDTGSVRSLLHQLRELPFDGRDHESSIAQWRVLQGFYDQKIAELPKQTGVAVRRSWSSLIHGEDRAKAFRAFEASTLLSLRTSLRRGSVWIAHSEAFRYREAMLISPVNWKTHRDQYVRLLHHSDDVNSFLATLRTTLQAGLAALAEAVARGAVTIDENHSIRIPALKALDIDREPIRTRDTLFRTIGNTQLPDILVEIDAATGFSQHLLARRATNDRELLSVYAALLAHGTEVDAKGVASMIPGIEPAHVSAAMRLIEQPGRLRRANQAVLDFQGRHAIAQLWGDGSTASADMMSLDASRHLWNARTDPRRRTFAAGLYTHVLNRHGIIYDLPIVLNERQVGPAIEGVTRYNAELETNSTALRMLAVDTHGYTHVGMAIAKFLGFDLCPRLASLAERKLYIPRNLHDVPDALESVVARDVSMKAIETGFDDILRAAASIGSGRVSAVTLLQRLGSAAGGDALYRAADHLGKLLRTIFLCDYFAQPEFRREIHTLLNRGESVHQLQRAIYYGRIAPERGRRTEEMVAISGAHALLANAVLAWNTTRMDHTVQQLRRGKVCIEDDWLRRMGPAHFSHINFRGTLQFPLQRYRDALISEGAERISRIS
jgi:TnpA family transposase